MLLILSGCGAVNSPQPVSEASAAVESEISATEPDINGSGFSSTINTIRELELDATVLDGFTTNFANVEDVSGDVAEWISGFEIVNQL